MPKVTDPDSLVRRVRIRRFKQSVSTLEEMVINDPNGDKALMPWDEFEFYKKLAAERLEKK